MDLTGKIIVSQPSLEDQRFFKSVIYICAHSKEGSMGFIINKKIDFDLYPDLLEQLGIEKTLNNKKLFFRYGGPVESSRGFVLHSDEEISKDSLKISKGVVLTSTIEFFDELVSKLINPKKSLLFNSRILLLLLLISLHCPLLIIRNFVISSFFE